MKKNIDKTAMAVMIIAGSLIAGSFIASLFIRHSEEEIPMMTHLRSILELDRITDTTDALVVGYNYHLLQKYAESNGQTIEIGIRMGDASYVDSLIAGSIDILAVPFIDSLDMADDSLTASFPIDSMTVWLMRKDDMAEMDRLNSWIAQWHESDEYEAVRNSFLHRFSAFRSRRRDCISPYDELIRSHSDSLGWDWRLLAAIIYQESRFHIEARSRRGAAGLMQMMPSTAARYGIEDPLDPEANIEAGARLLGNLLHRYRNVAADKEEQYKYALAAYNAGIGRVDDILNLARYREIDTGYWENVVAVIPEMSDEALKDTGAVRLGPFKGTETIAYVNRVLDIYREFCRICPQ